jgi:hypothetical protein
MKMTGSIPFTAVLICLALSARPVLLHADPIDDLEKLSLSLEKSLDSLQTGKSRLQKEGASVAARLNVLRARELLSPGEHRQAERLLQQSQSLGVQMEKTDREIADSKRRYDSSIEETVAACRSKLIELGAEVETADAVQKPRLLATLRILLEKKTAWESRMAAPNAILAQNPSLELQPWNSRTEIRLKGDILQDEARSVRSEIVNVEKRLRSLREEKEVRKNVAEMSKELALFNEGDELLGRHLASASPEGVKSAENTNTDREFRNTGEAAGPVVENLFLPSQRQNVSPFPPNASGLNDQISVLEEYKRLLAARADSLEQKASWFYRKARLQSN